MKLTVTQENLSKALSNVSRVASGRNELAILNNILFRTDGNRLLIASTNLELASKQYIGTKITKPGSITVPARLISEFISSLPSGAIDLEVKDDHLHIKADGFSSTINGIIAEEFPELPLMDEKKSVNYEIQASELKKALSQTIIASSNDTTRPVLTGVYWHTIDGELFLVATDGYRLAERLLLKTTNETRAIIPTSTLQEVMRNLTDETEKLQVLFDDTQVCFKTPNIEIISRLIDGKFPDYRQLIPTKSEVVSKVSKADFSRITKVASLFARESGGGITISTSVDKSTISIHSVASELGENTSEAPAKITNTGEITINSKYLLDVLSVVDGESLEFSFNGKLAPCILKEDKKKVDYLYIIMPMKS